MPLTCCCGVPKHCASSPDPEAACLQLARAAGVHGGTRLCGSCADASGGQRQRLHAGAVLPLIQAAAGLDRRAQPGAAGCAASHSSRAGTRPGDWLASLLCTCASVPSHNAQQACCGRCREVCRLSQQASALTAHPPLSPGPAAGLPQMLWLANVHLEASPYRPNDRVSQLRSALQRLESHIGSSEGEWRGGWQRTHCTAV